MVRPGGRHPCRDSRWWSAFLRDSPWQFGVHADMAHADIAVMPPLNLSPYRRYLPIRRPITGRRRIVLATIPAFTPRLGIEPINVYNRLTRRAV